MEENDDYLFQISKRTVPCITINTDASFNPHHKVGGYAFYIKCDYFKIKKSGIFKVKPKTPEEAEMMCMANAFHILGKQPDLPKTKLIIINSDCLNSFKKIKRKTNNIIAKTVAQKLRFVRRKCAIRSDIYPKYEFRHVRAHTNNNDPRSLVNEWCDVEAKKQMRLSLKELK